MRITINTAIVARPDVRESLMHGKPVPGLDVFITATRKDGSLKTVPGILNPLGREVFGASLDPDAEEPYVASDTDLGICQTLLGDLVGEYIHFRIWSNGLANNIIVFQDFDADNGIAITNTEKLELEIEIPFGQDDVVFHGGSLK